MTPRNGNSAAIDLFDSCRWTERLYLLEQVIPK
jgi:hypothetical protein